MQEMGGLLEGRCLWLSGLGFFRFQRVNTCNNLRAHRVGQLARISDANLRITAQSSITALTGNRANKPEYPLCPAFRLGREQPQPCDPAMSERLVVWLQVPCFRICNYCHIRSGAAPHQAPHCGQDLLGINEAILACRAL
ncbi:hypothetical protein D3C84_868430 [compost metagenome]